MRHHHLLLAFSLLASAAGLAQAQSFEFHHRVKGIAPVAPPAPACVDAKNAPVGEISDQFCGSEGIELFNAGLVAGHAILYGMADDATSSQWSSSKVDIPDLPNCSSNTVCMSYTDGPAYTAAMSRNSSSALYAVSACTRKEEGWYLPSMPELRVLAEARGHANFARLNTVTSGYRTSTENSAGGSTAILFNTWPSSYNIVHAADKVINVHLRVRCARRG
jgi:hypothetical protein